MSDLRLKLDTTDFKELVELGRSMIPTVAPGWTDHNIHDPGIMLMELVAWIADAQIYALSRTSRGEREAFGRLLGLRLTGPQPAQGLVWPLDADADPAAHAPWPAGTVLEKGARTAGDRPQAPPFFTTRRVELTTARLTKAATVFAGGTTRDWTRANTQQGATFLPFGDAPEAGTTLELTLDGTLIGSPASGAPLAIGFEVVTDGDDSTGQPEGSEAPACNSVRLRVSLRDDTGPWPVTIEEDTTGGLARSGVVLLKIDPALAGRSGRFTLSIDSEGGRFLLPPRLQRIALNVMPIEQVERVNETAGPFGTDTPGQEYRLKRSGLMFPVDAQSFKVFVSAGGPVSQEWTRVEGLSSAAPNATVYALDESRGTITFGNGINGRRPAAGAELRVEYLVTSGAQGNLPRGILWEVAGVTGTFGTNRQGTSGGTESRDLAALRATARRRVRQNRPIVTTRDLESAALAFADLDVRRVQEVVAGSSPRRLAGSRVLVAVGQESAIWLQEIRRRLAPRLPLGQSLTVIAPRFVDVSLIARLVAAPQVDPKQVRSAVEKKLRASLAVVPADGVSVWPFGRDLTALTVKGWLRNVEGIARVERVSLRTASAPDGTDRVELGPIALPRLRLEDSDIAIERSPIGGAA